MTTTLRVSEKLWKFLNANKNMGESFEEVIWRYIDTNSRMLIKDINRVKRISKTAKEVENERIKTD